MERNWRIRTCKLNFLTLRLGVLLLILFESVLIGACSWMHVTREGQYECVDAYDRVADMMFPLSVKSRNRHDALAFRMLSHDISEEPGDREYSYILYWERSVVDPREFSLRAHAVIADGYPLATQMLMHSVSVVDPTMCTKRNLDLAELSKKISVNRWDIGVEQCESLSVIMNHFSARLEKLLPVELTGPDGGRWRAPIVVHPRTFELMAADSLRKIHVSSTYESDPMIEWIRSARKMIDICLQDAASAPSPLLR